MGIHSVNSLLGTSPLGHGLSGLISTDRKRVHFPGWWSEFLYAVPSTYIAEDLSGFLIVSILPKKPLSFIPGLWTSLVMPTGTISVLITTCIFKGTGTSSVFVTLDMTTGSNFPIVHGPGYGILKDGCLQDLPEVQTYPSSLEMENLLFCPPRLSSSVTAMSIEHSRRDPILLLNSELPWKSMATWLRRSHGESNYKGRGPGAAGRKKEAA